MLVDGAVWGWNKSFVEASAAVDDLTITPVGTIQHLQVSGSVLSMDFTVDGMFVMLNSSGMDMVIVNVETCERASSENMKTLRYWLSRQRCLTIHFMFYVRSE